MQKPALPRNPFTGKILVSPNEHGPGMICRRYTHGMARHPCSEVWTFFDIRKEGTGRDACFSGKMRWFWLETGLYVVSDFLYAPPIRELHVASHGDEYNSFFFIDIYTVGESGGEITLDLLQVYSEPRTL